jgi:hypothetical protein
MYGKIKHLNVVVTASGIILISFERMLRPIYMMRFFLTIVVCNLLTPSLRHESCRVDSPTTCLRQSYATQKSRKKFKTCFKILRLWHTFLMKK